jgi:hypothetical protein
VEEFREIWFQNSADPPSFASLGMAQAIEDENSDMEDTERDSEQLFASQAENRQGLPQLQTEDAEVGVAEAESAFLEEMVEDRILEDEINRHLHDQEFHQALAEIDGMYLPLLLIIVIGQTNPAVEDGNLSDLDDDDEVVGAIIDPDSENFLLRAQLWMESNRDYLKEQRGPANVVVV